jgi:hypothetical protein
VAGAVAIAVSASVATAGRLEGQRLKPGPFMDAVLTHTPPSLVRTRLGRARRMLSVSGDEVAYELRNGSGDRVGGDIDTPSAITGGIVAAYTGADAIPPDWLAAREPLPTWLTETG